MVRTISLRPFIRVPRLRGLVLLPLLVVAPATLALTEKQWACSADAEGNWTCEQAEVDVGPFEPVATAPVYSQRRARQEAGGGTGTVAGQTTEQAQLTWVPRQALPSAERDQVPEWCGGAYQEREWTDEELASDPVSTLLGLSADRAEYLVDREAALEGGVKVEQGARRLSADSARYDEATRQLMLEGDILLQEPGLLMRGESATVDLLTGDAEIDAARFVLYEGGYRGSAAQLSRVDEVLRVEDAEFTHCPPGNESWKVAAGRIEFPEGGAYAVARNARLEVKGVPVFWAPSLTLPVENERKSGLLFPAMSYSEENGADIAAPYYLNLAPNYDATITPRLMSERGVAVEGEIRQLGAHSRNTLGGAFLPDDDNYNGELSFDEFSDLVESGRRPPGVFEAEDRWLARFEHQGRWLPGLTTEVDFTAVSDDDYLRDLGSGLSVSSTPELDREAAITLRRGALEARLWAQDIQLLEEGLPEAYQRLPQFDLSWHDRFGDVPMVFGMDFQYAEFDRNDAAATGAEAVTGSRTHMVPRFTLPLESSWGWLEADVAWQYTRYALSNVRPGVEDDPTRILPTGSLDMGLRFERDLALAGTPLLQTLEPRLHYLYIRDEDQDDLPLFDTAELTFGPEQMFRTNRFSSIDRIGDANQLSLATTSRLLSRTDGRELVSATVGRILYFEDREVTLSGDPRDVGTEDQSGWLTDLVVRLGGGFDARALWVWDNENGDRDQSSFRIRYHGDERRLFNVGYRSRGRNLEQADLNFSWPVTPQWAVVGRYFYDLEEEQTIETFGGLQYDDCCWRLRLVGRQYRRPWDGLEDTETDTGVFLQVVMKGLAGFDGGVQSILEDGIHGYREQSPHGTQF
jgi:LPS-assembly protein